MGDLFGGSKSDKPVSLEPAWQTALRKRLALAAEPKGMERIERAGEAYPGELVAPLGEHETLGLEQLGKYLKTPLPTEGGLYGAARGEVERTLGGEEYDPFKGEYYQAFQENLKRQLQEAKDRLAARTSARDAFYGGGRVAGEAELEETATGGMRQELGRLYETERVRRLGTVPMATEMLAFEERMPLGRIAATQEYGALPREWEQATLDAERMEWLRQLTELGIPLDVAMQMSTYTPAMYQPTYGPSPFAQASPGLAELFSGIGQIGGGESGGKTDWAQLAVTAAPFLLAMSDIRVKENIKPMNDSLEKVKILEGKTYNFIATPDKRDGGIIAQDLEKALPEAIVEIGGIKHIKLDAVLGLLVNAINELNQKVDASLN